MAKLSNIPEISTDILTYNPATRNFSAFIDGLPCLQRIYDDACDQGFYLVSHKTGKRVLVVYSHDERDSDGDITSFILSAHCINENPEDLLDLTVTIFND